MAIRVSDFDAIQTVRFFRVLTFDERALVTRTTTGEIAALGQGIALPDVAPIIGIVLGSCPGTLCLTVDVDRRINLMLSPGTYRAVFAPVYLAGQVLGAPVNLVDPLGGRLLCAPPTSNPLAVGRVAADRDAPSLWESFTLVPSPPSVNAGVTERVEMLTRLLSSKIEAHHLTAFIRTQTGSDGGCVLNAVLPLLAYDELAQLSAALMNDDQLSMHLQQMSGHDPWASQALPSLLKRQTAKSSIDQKKAQTLFRRFSPFSWFAKKSGHSRREDVTSGEPGCRTKLRIGAEFDHVAYDGVKGSFVSLTHACNIIARQFTRPIRKSCIITTARNEGVYLLEWIAYHKAIGIEWFFVYSNNNEDQSDALLSALADAGVITWIASDVAPGVSAQSKALGHALSMLPDVLDFEWSLVVDLDEFLVLNQHRFDTVSEFIRWQKRNIVDAIALNWVFVGSELSESPEHELLTTRNRRLLGKHQVGEGYRLVKTFSRPNAVMHSAPHHPRCHERRSLVYRLGTGEIHRYDNNPDGFHHDPSFADSVNTENACVYHYFFKSAEEWLWKGSRNRGNHAVATSGSSRLTNERWIREFMVQHDAVGLPMEQTMAARSASFNAELAALRSVPAIAEAAAITEAAFRSRLEAVKHTLRESVTFNDMSELSQRFFKLAKILT